MASNLRQSTSPGAGSSALLAALGPALVAAVASFASSMTARRSNGASGGDHPSSAEEVRHAAEEAAGVDVGALGGEVWLCGRVDSDPSCRR